MNNDPFWQGFRRGLLQGFLVGLPCLIAAFVWSAYQ